MTHSGLDRPLDDPIPSGNPPSAEASGTGPVRDPPWGWGGNRCSRIGRYAGPLCTWWARRDSSFGIWSRIPSEADVLHESRRPGLRCSSSKGLSDLPSSKRLAPDDDPHEFRSPSSGIRLPPLGGPRPHSGPSSLRSDHASLATPKIFLRNPWSYQARMGDGFRHEGLGGAAKTGTRTLRGPQAHLKNASRTSRGRTPGWASLRGPQ